MADRILYHEDVAELLGITAGTWRRYCSESPKRRRIAPPPDDHDIEGGHVRPWWRESTIRKWDAARKGAGHRSDLHGL